MYGVIGMLPVCVVLPYYSVTFYKRRDACTATIVKGNRKGGERVWEHCNDAGNSRNRSVCLQVCTLPSVGVRLMPTVWHTWY